jgi:hypothetical protein
MTDTNTALAVREYPKLAELTGFSNAQIGLIRETAAKGLSIIELATFLYNARRLKLEPLLGQIYAIRYDRNGPPDIVTGINGYRSRAADSGEYAGSDDPVFEYADVGQPEGAPSKATVTVWRIVKGTRCPFTSSARWEEFYPDHGRNPTRQGEQYRKRPHNQLAIRAESHALRKAFPYQMNDLEPQSAPPEWVEAAEEDQRIIVQHEPERVARNAATYGRIFDAEYDEERDFGAQPAPSSAAVAAAAVEAVPAETRSPSAGSPLVSDKNHKLWKAWLAAESAARKSGFEGDTSHVHLPISEHDLQQAIDTLLGDVEAN